VGAAGHRAGAAHARYRARPDRAAPTHAATASADPKVTPTPLLPPEPHTPSKKEIVVEALVQTRGDVKAALKLLSDRGVSVDRSYVYEIKREARAERSGRVSAPVLR